MNRPEICLSDFDELHVQSAKMLEAVSSSGRPVFTYGGHPYRIITSDGRARLQPLDVVSMRHEVSSSAKCTRRRSQTNGSLQVYEVYPPKDVIADALVSDSFPFNPLTAISRHPTMSPSGKVLNQPGYDAETGLFIDGVIEGLSIPDKPTSMDATDAMGILGEMLTDFPFPDDASMAGVLAMFLTLLLRPMICGTVPIFVILAPSPGAGKTLLASAIFEAINGTPPPLMTETKNPDELQKAMLAVLMESPEVIFIDNINGALDSGVIAAIATAGIIKGRVLGRSEMIEVPVKCPIILTANSPIMTNELVRRCVPINLEPSQEKPWTRTGFKHPDLHGFIQDHRAEILRAGLVLARFWVSAGRPCPQGRPLGSFEEWYRIIGGILECSGCKDLLGNTSQFYDSTDTVSGAWVRFVEMWFSQYPVGGVSAKDLLSIAIEAEIIDEGKTPRASQTSLGKALSRNKGRIYSGNRIRQLGIASGCVLWGLEKVP